MFLEVEEEDSRCSRFNPRLLLISKEHGLEANGISYQQLRSWCHMRLKQQSEKKLKITFANPSKNSARKEENKKKHNCKTFSLLANAKTVLILQKGKNITMEGKKQKVIEELKSIE